jgi:hypothetical protein
MPLNLDDLLAMAIELAVDPDPPAVFAPFADYGFAVEVAGLTFIFDCDCLEEMQTPKL